MGAQGTSLPKLQELAHGPNKKTNPGSPSVAKKTKPKQNKTQNKTNKKQSTTKLSIWLFKWFKSILK